MVLVFRISVPGGHAASRGRCSRPRGNGNSRSSERRCGPAGPMHAEERHGAARRCGLDALETSSGTAAERAWGELAAAAVTRSKPDCRESPLRGRKQVGTVATSRRHGRAVPENLVARAARWSPRRDLSCVCSGRGKRGQVLTAPCADHAGVGSLDGRPVACRIHRHSCRQRQQTLERGLALGDGDALSVPDRSSSRSRRQALSPGRRRPVGIWQFQRLANPVWSGWPRGGERLREPLR